MKDKKYGAELILDLHNCDPSTFRRSVIEEFMTKCCEIMEVEQCALYFWDDVGIPEDEKQTDPKTKGTTAVQFLLQSNITIHTLDMLDKVFINLFSCKKFNTKNLSYLAVETFKGKIVNHYLLDRL